MVVFIALQGLDFPAVTVCSSRAVTNEKLKLEACRRNISANQILVRWDHFTK